MATTKNFSIWPEIPEDALLTRQQVVSILHIVQLEEQKFQWEVQHAKRQCFYSSTTGIE